jgi:hypothetical protein
LMPVPTMRPSAENCGMGTILTDAGDPRPVPRPAIWGVVAGHRV